MSEVSTIGLDIAKHVFQAHGADASGCVVFRKKITRSKLIEFLAFQPRCMVAHWKLAELPIIGAGRSASWATRSG